MLSVAIKLRSNESDFLLADASLAKTIETSGYRVVIVLVLNWWLTVIATTIVIGIVIYIYNNIVRARIAATAAGKSSR